MNARFTLACFASGSLTLPVVLSCQKEETTEEPAATAELAPINGPATVVMTVNGTTITHVAGSGNTEIIFTEQSGGPTPDTSSAVFLSGFFTGSCWLSWRWGRGPFQRYLSAAMGLKCNGATAPGSGTARIAPVLRDPSRSRTTPTSRSDHSTT